MDMDLNSGRIRIKDIADKAGVSVGTVDRILHNRGNVSPAAAARVRAVLESVEYSPNIIASTLAYNKTLRIAAVVPDHADDDYWEAPRNGIARALKNVQHYGVIVDFFLFDQAQNDSFVQACRRALQSSPAALITAPIFHSEALALLGECAEQEIPVALFNTYLEHAHVLSYIGQDSYQAGHLAGKLLSLQLAPEAELVILHMEQDVDNANHIIQKERGFRDFFIGKDGSDARVRRLVFQSLDDPQKWEAFIRSELLDRKGLGGVFVSTSRAHKLAPYLLGSGIRLVGFDLIPQNIECLRAGSIDFLINQNPEEQGYLSVLTLVNHLVLKKQIPPMQSLALDIVVPENLRFYLQRMR